MKVMYTGQMRNGTPLPDIVKMVHYNHPEVEFIPYNRNKGADVILGINRTMGSDIRKIRKVMYVGSVPSFLKSSDKKLTKRVDHTFFISEYCRKIFINSKWEFKSYSVFLPFGSLPYDSSMEPVADSRKIEGPIQFVSVAKWYKRPYKRQQQVIKLYNKFLKKEYPDSILHLIGSPRNEIRGNIHYHKKSFHSDEVINLFKKCHVHIIPTPFDTGPKTVPESLHYKIPFVCSNNCAGIEYINHIGKCGIEVKTDPVINDMQNYKKLDPLNYKSKYTKNQIPYKDYLKAVKIIIDNFKEYTSWQWPYNFNYKIQSDKLYNILKG